MTAGPVPLEMFLGMPPERSPYLAEQVALEASNALLNAPVGLRALRSRPLWRRLWEGFTGTGQERVAAVAGDLLMVQRATLDLVKEVMDEEARTQYCVNQVLQNLHAVNDGLVRVAGRFEDCRRSTERQLAELRVEATRLGERVAAVDRKVERDASVRLLTEQFRSGDLHPGSGKLLGAALYLAQVGRLFAGDPGRAEREWRAGFAVVRQRLGSKTESTSDLLLEASLEVEPSVREACVYVCASGGGPALSVVQVLLERQGALLRCDGRSAEEAVQVSRAWRDPQNWLGVGLRWPLELAEQCARELLQSLPGMRHE